MLLPADERSPVVYPGYQGFDANRVGYISTKGPGGLNAKQAKGVTKVVVGGDGVKHCDRNSGQGFSYDVRKGIIGPKFINKAPFPYDHHHINVVTERNEPFHME